MATQLFKDGESVFVPAAAVQRHLAAGWSPNEPGLPVLEIIEPLRAMGIYARPEVGAMHVPV